jgi:sugar phosphate permease
VQAEEPILPDEPSDVRRNRVTAWGVTWLSYAAYYFGRKAISVSKKTILDQLGKGALNGVDTAYLASYAAGQYMNGWLGDRIGARRLITAGMFCSAIACFVFGASSTGTLFIAAMIANGLAQSTGWPGNIKAMGEWTTPNTRGRIMGLWSTCYQVGGIAATAFAAYLLGKYGYRSSFDGCAAVLALVALVVFALLRTPPRAATSEDASDGKSTAERTKDRDDAEAKARKEAQRAVLRHGTIWCYGASYFFIKLIRYSLLFWLPFYLETVLKYPKDEAGYLSTSFEIGGIAGTIGIGILSDRYRSISRSIWAAGSLVLLAVALYAYAQVGGMSKTVNFAAMAVVGALLFGPDSLLSGAAAQDAGGPYAAAIAAGLINGVGSIGAIAQEYVTRELSERYGWNALFNAFLVFALLGALALAPTFKKVPKAPAAIEKKPLV